MKVKKKNYLPPALASLILLAGLYYFSHSLKPSSLNQTLSTPTPTIQASANTSTSLGQQTKTTGCVAQGPLPDKACSPGAIFPTATKEQICVSGYSSSVRNVSTSEKDQVYQEYGIMSHTTGQYEVDHLISLELGGSNDIANLWPEAAEPRPGYHEKDLVENYLHAQVCDGSMSLQEAQQKIANDWLSVYRSVPNIDSYKY